ncbi:MAG: TonB-dependent receptor [Novosphingobium sp.]
MRLFYSLPLSALVFAAPALADQAPMVVQAQAAAPQGAPTAAVQPQPDDLEPLANGLDQAGEIVVIATRIKGQIDAPQAPIQTLNEEDIAAYGVTSVADLISALAPQTGTGRGRGGGFPVMLLNGQRISSFREMRNIPPEAIRKMEVLPEEVALRFGYSPNQRVVNIILKDKFAATTAELEYGQPDRGGTSTTKAEGSRFSVNGQSRLNLTGSYSRTTPLTEAERNVIQTPASLPTVSTDPDPAVARTLVSRSNDAQLNATWARGLGEKGLDGSLTLNGSVERTNNLSLSGLNIVVLTDPNGATATRTFGAPLTRATRSTTVSGGVGLNKPLGDWQLSATVDASHAYTTTMTDTRANVSALVSAAAAATGTLAIGGALPTVATTAPDRVQVASDSATGLITLVGRSLRLPAGNVVATVKTGFAYTGISSLDSRSGAGQVSLRRGDLSAGINLGVPLTSRREGFLGAIGDLTLNLSGGLDRLSDFGTLTDWSAGLTWAPTDKLNFQASYIVNQQAPSLSSLGNPMVTTLNVPVYDYTTGRTVLVSVISGGNRGLLRETDRDLKLGMNWQLPILKNSNLVVEYFRNNSDNVTASFPVLTPAIEAAFPGRVVRDEAGNLVSIDQRSVTLANETGSRLRYGFNIGGTIGKASADQPGGGGRGGRMGGRGGGEGGGMGGFGSGGRGGGQGRWNLAAYDTLQFSNRVLIAPGVPVLDLLNGDALTAGGVSRHNLTLEGGAFYKGVGLRMNGTYVTPVDVRGSGASDLHFGGLARFTIRMFADLGQQKWLTGGNPDTFWKGARFQLKIDNVFDARQRVTDQNGLVPISYQPDLIDPQGRIIGIELRKQF